MTEQVEKVIPEKVLDLPKPKTPSEGQGVPKKLTIGQVLRLCKSEVTWRDNDFSAYLTRNNVTNLDGGEVVALIFGLETKSQIERELRKHYSDVVVQRLMNGYKTAHYETPPLLSILADLDLICPA